MEVNRVNYAPPAAPAPPAQVVDTAPVLEGTAAPAPAVTDADIYGPERTGVRLERAVAELNQSLAPHSRHMSIGTHESTGRTMVTVYNTDTREVIREIPPERVLDAHASLLEMAGLFMDRRG